jgi:hypothetical protein
LDLGRRPASSEDSKGFDSWVDVRICAGFWWRWRTLFVSQVSKGDEEEYFKSRRVSEWDGEENFGNWRVSEGDGEENFGTRRISKGDGEENRRLGNKDGEFGDEDGGLETRMEALEMRVGDLGKTVEKMDKKFGV